MNVASTRSKGALGVAAATPGQGAQSSPETIAQSCPTSSQVKRSTQFRLRLSPRHAQRWMALPPGLRTHAANVVFGAYTLGIELRELLEVASELRSARTTINNALQLALARGGRLDAERIGAAVDRIAALLGERP